MKSMKASATSQKSTQATNNDLGACRYRTKHCHRSSSHPRSLRQPAGAVTFHHTSPMAGYTEQMVTSESHALPTEQASQSATMQLAVRGRTQGFR